MVLRAIGTPKGAQYEQFADHLTGVDKPNEIYVFADRVISEGLGNNISQAPDKPLAVAVNQKREEARLQHKVITGRQMFLLLAEHMKTGTGHTDQWTSYQELQNTAFQGDHALALFWGGGSKPPPESSRVTASQSPTPQSCICCWKSSSTRIS